MWPPFVASRSAVAPSSCNKQQTSGVASFQQGTFHSDRSRLQHAACSCLAARRSRTGLAKLTLVPCFASYLATDRRDVTALGSSEEKRLRGQKGSTGRLTVSAFDV